MGFVKRAGRLTKPILDIPSALDTRSIRNNTNTLRRFIRIALRRRDDRPESLENFDEAVNRLGLTQADIKSRMREFKFLAWVLLFLFFGLVGYTGMHILEGNWFAVLPSLVISCIALVLSFRYHFWYYQVKNGKLGCTFKEWWAALIGR
jgi:intracellular multiplication protein IcmV